MRNIIQSAFCDYKVFNVSPRKFNLPPFSPRAPAFFVTFSGALYLNLTTALHNANALKTECFAVITMIKQALATASIALALAGIPAQAYKVGIALPTQNEQRWYKEGPEIAKALEEAGFDTELYYAGDGDLATQQRQIARMVKEKYDALIVTPVKADGLSEALKAPLKARVPVISYDRLILRNCPKIT